MKDKLLVVLMAIGITVGIWSVVSFLVAIPVYFLYDWVVAGEFGAPQLSYLQIWGLLVLKVLVIETKTQTEAK